MTRPARIRPPYPIHDALRQAGSDEILAATAHELRLPLSHIKGFVSTLRRGDVKWDEETRHDLLGEIDIETERLAELIDALLVTRIPDYRRGIGPAELAFVRPIAVVQGALHRVRGLLQGRPLHVEVSPRLASVQMHANQMERVLGNLIQNAIKYSPPGTAIGISARMTDDAELMFSVDDQGPGIPRRDRARIFEPFFRNKAALTSHVDGHGLGLAICQSIVLAHGGHISVTNAPGGGARFNVYIPATRYVSRTAG